VAVSLFVSRFAARLVPCRHRETVLGNQAQAFRRLALALAAIDALPAAQAQPPFQKL
jgi:hypothetical protein